MDRQSGRVGKTSLVRIAQDQAVPTTQNSADLARDDGRNVTYLTGHFPMVSHTFILREILELRALGLRVATASVRRPGKTELIGKEEVEAERSTFYLASAASDLFRLAWSNMRRIVRRPRPWLEAAGIAWKTRHYGVAAGVRQVAYFLEASLLADYMDRTSATHLHNHFADSSCTVAMLASAMTGIPFSFTIHGPTEFYDVSRWSFGEKVSRAKFVICISNFARSQMMLFSDQAHWGKLTIVHCGIELEKYGLGHGSEYRKRVLFVGRLAAVKGVRLLLEAVRDLHESHPDMKLTIVGDGPERTALEQLASSFGLKRIVKFVGYQPQNEVAGLLSQSDMLVLPSFAEGVPVVLMEAMASRLPVIASHVAGVPELVEDGVSGYLVPPGDRLALTQRLDALLSHTGLAAKMGEAGRAKVEREFSIKNEAMKLKALFEM